MVKLMCEPAPAKINLFLRVTGRRPDGYHELDSIFVPVSICDDVAIEVRPARMASVQLLCDSPAIPVDHRNLACRAAHAFLTEFAIQADVLIRLRKQIPAGAGLGGGSSDAGAVLRMMARIYGAGEAALQPIALRLGADVPFFLNPVPSRVRGIGEWMEPLDRMAKLPLLIAVPPIEVPTALVFADLQPEHWTGPESDSDLLAFVEGRIGPEHLVNDLEQVAIAKWPQIGELKKLLQMLGARAAAMTGSGGGVFAIFDSTAQAADAHHQIERRAPQVKAFTASML